MPDRKRAAGSGLLDQLPTDLLVEQGRQLLFLMAERALERAVDSVEGLAERLLDYAQHGEPGLRTAITGRSPATRSGPPLRATVKARITDVSESVRQTVTGVPGRRGNGPPVRVLNIIEQIDVGVPVRPAYDRWTRFQDFPQFMKTIRAVEKVSDGTSTWKVQIFWSDRDWEATIVEQIPDERIAWRSEGAKGRVDGVVSFHPIAPNMTRILLALEYYPQGLLERAGNLWHVQVRRVRTEIRRFRCHVMTRVVHDPDSVQGWRGEIRGGRVVRTHEEATAAETPEPDESPERAEVPDAPAEDGPEPDPPDGHTDTLGDSDDERDVDDDLDDGYDDPDDGYDDAVDEDHEYHDEYDDEPEHERVPSGRR